MESVVSVQRTVKISNKDVQQILFSLLVLSLQFTSVFKGVLPAAGLPSLSSSLKRWRLWKSPNVTIVGWASDVYNMLLETLSKRMKGWKLWKIRRYPGNMCIWDHLQLSRICCWGHSFSFNEFDPDLKMRIVYWWHLTYFNKSPICLHCGVSKSADHLFENHSKYYQDAIW